MFLFINSNAKEDSGFNSTQMLLISAGLIFVVSTALYIGAMFTDQYYRNHDPRVKESYEDEKLSRELDETSLKFLSIPITALYYVNVEEIGTIYSTYFGEDIVTSITSETSEESGGEISAVFSKIFGVKQAGKDSTKIIKNFKPKEETILAKFLRYQRAVILRKQITLDLDNAPMDYRLINEFDDTVAWLVHNQGVDLTKSTDELNSKRAELLQVATTQTIERLETAKDLILLEGKFLVTQNDNNYICTYFHPVNQVFPYQDMQVTIKFLIPKEETQKAIFDFNQVIDKYIPLRIFGKVVLPVDRSTFTWEMLVKPIGVY